MDTITLPRNASGPKLRARRAKRQQPDSIPDLFTRAFHECRRRKPHLFPAKHLSWTEEQLHTYLMIAWEKAGPRRQKYYRNPADGLAKNQSQPAMSSEPVTRDVKPAPRITSGAQRRKAPTRSRTKRTVASPPPETQAQPATPPPLDGLEHMPSPLTPQSTCSSISVPLQTVVRSADSTLRAVGGLLQARRTGDALPARMSPLSTVLVQPEDGAASSEAYPPFPVVPPSYIPIQHPSRLGPASGVSGDPGMWRGISGSVGSGGIPVPEVDPSLLDMQRQMREQMSRYYPSLHPSLGYAHMLSAVEHWPWR
ncbi:hypothetical protein GSI_04927 [Ganoderma sinense ZZ0214-1]|uniref:Uncharacterized protein n=1 Tax=Ganoderma sinense ZZ0214-1 TaxID=1077348 RepID=A0A2G8SGB0_9APHY|nr:hypothetical protein GSI_04927 [Ganoderma sinense ZZ0214-1]